MKENGKHHPVQFGSLLLSDEEQWFSTFIGKALAVIFALKTFCHFWCERLVQVSATTKR